MTKKGDVDMTDRETLEELIVKTITAVTKNFYIKPKYINYCKKASLSINIDLGKNLLLAINLNHEFYDILVTGELYDNGERLVTAFYTYSNDEIACEFDIQTDDEQVNKIINVLSKYLGETI